MKLRIASLSFVLVCLACFPAFADTIYDNGPINGTTDAWTISFRFVVSDTFTVGSGGATITGLSFGAWFFPGDFPSQLELSITSDEFGGTTYLDQSFGQLDIMQSNCVMNQYGFNVCVVGVSFSPVHLDAGTYWLNLMNTNGGLDDPVYWDENSGPSQASENSVGTVPSEAFTILGTNGTTTSTTTTTGATVPEPSSIMLLGSGILGLGGVFRRKLF